MAWHSWLTGAPEKRDSLENPGVSLADGAAWSAIFGAGGRSSSGVDVTAQKALGVPAIWGAVNFISGTFAALPLQVFKKEGDNRLTDDGNPLYAILHDVVNDDNLTSFAWRKQAMTEVLINSGRSYTYIERNRAGRVMNLWPLETSKMTVSKVSGYREYTFKDGGRVVKYTSDEIIDIPFLMQADGITHYAPASCLKNAIGLAIALEDYAAKFFQNGGVPPLALSGPPMSPQAASRASNDVQKALQRASDDQKNIIILPSGHELKPIGVDPDKSQLVEARRFQLLEVARTYGLPPTFLQDLQFGTFSNTEQQDLQFVKHTLTQWLNAWEGEMNAKLFGLRNRKSYVEFNVDGLLRGDFASRMQGYATGINNAVLKPNEARKMENRPADKNGDELLIQGATVPLGKQPDPNADPAKEAPKPKDTANDA